MTDPDASQMTSESCGCGPHLQVMAGGGCSGLGVRQLCAQRSGLGLAGVEVRGGCGGLLAAPRCRREGISRLQLGGGKLLL